MELRSYQKTQLEFLDKYKGICRGIESPTGTGKSIVLLEYIKRVQNEYDTIVLTTGFNELVFQIAEDAQKMGISFQILIGESHLVPNMNENDKIYYSKEPINACNNCVDNRSCDVCAKKSISNFLKRKKKIIITNHSYFITFKHSINADLVIIDEAHAFPGFYESSLTSKIEGKEYAALKNYLNNSKTPLAFAFKEIFNCKNCDERILKCIFAEISKTAASGFNEKQLKNFERNFYNVFGISKSGFFEEEENSFRKTELFNKIDLKSNGHNPDIILASATLDGYTLKMFNCNKEQIYKQKLPEDRYTKSLFISCRKSFYDNFENIFESNFSGKGRGLILCTSIVSVNWVYNKLKERGEEVFKDKDKFNAARGNAVLIGSKKFFQGINVEVDYVILDKLPFAIYDERFKIYSKFIELTTKTDPWLNYTVPLMKNSLLQALGRLWRKNDIDNGVYDNGTICIFDERLGGKMHFVEDFILGEKKNIGFKIIE